MKFEKHLPSEKLRPHIRYFVIAENGPENEYKVFPSPGLVIGFQYSGRLSSRAGNTETKLATAGITGMTDTFKIFKSSSNTGTILVYFTETGFVHFTAHPANELFNLSISLDEIFHKEAVKEVEEKLSFAATDKQRLKIIDQFFLSHLKNITTDKMIVEAVKLIYQSKGAIRIKELNQKLFISQSPFEKRFRKIVGTTPKKFANVIRFNTVLEQLGNTRSLTDICYENNFFDQAHFSKDFRHFTGDTPENFKNLL